MAGGPADPEAWDRWFGWPLTIALFVALAIGIVRALRWSRHRLQELAA